MCAVKLKHQPVSTLGIAPFERLTEKEKHLVNLDFSNFWFKVMVRRNICVVAVLSIVLCVNSGHRNLQERYVDLLGVSQLVIFV